jgi:hypothetical protein
MLAQARNCPIEYHDVCVGLADECRKLGRQMPVELTAIRNTSWPQGGTRM